DVRRPASTQTQPFQQLVEVAPVQPEGAGRAAQVVAVLAQAVRDQLPFEAVDRFREGDIGVRKGAEGWSVCDHAAPGVGTEQARCQLDDPVARSRFAEGAYHRA